MVDGFLIHAPTKRKCFKAFSEFMDHTVRLGFICQQAKTRLAHPPSCRSSVRATIQYAFRESLRGTLTGLTLAVLTGLLQSLVNGTPQRMGQPYLWELYNELHERGLMGKGVIIDVVMSAEALADLEW
jgi:hypothetical protein